MDVEATLMQLSKLGETADRDTRRNLITQLRMTANLLEDDIGTIHRYGHLELQKSMVQVGLELGLFKILVEANGPLTADEVAKKAGADPQLMRRILQYYNAVYIVTEVATSTFTANKITRNLTDEVVTAALGHYYGMVSRQYMAIPSSLKSAGYQNPTDETRTAFHEGWNTTMTPFQWMAEHPQQLDHFNTYMALRRGPNTSWLSVYPVLEETKGLDDPERVLYVNVGGGIGHQCAEFRNKYPASQIPGRVVLQDLPATIERALPTEGVENMAHDFFQPQPVKGAKFYFMRGVPHNHPPHKVKQLFANIKAAMAADSVFLVDEAVLPDQNVGFVAASIDLTMMSGFAGMGRTEGDWRELAESVGLELVRSFTYNAAEYETVMDIRLPREGETDV